MIEIRWHGRGGQGAITAAKIFATAAFRSGYTGVVMAPTFGTERRGAPVFTSLKLAKEKIYDISPIETPDIVVVLDHLLLTEADVTGGLKEGGLIVLNSPKPPAAYDFGSWRLAVADVTSLSVQAGLPHGRVNSGIIGSLCKAFDLVGLPEDDVSTCECDGQAQDKDARSANSSAIGACRASATEDDVLCRPVHSGGRDFVFRQPLIAFAVVLEEIEAEFQSKKPQANAGAARLAYDNTVMKGA